MMAGATKHSEAAWWDNEGLSCCTRRKTEYDLFIVLAQFERELELSDGLTTNWKPIDALCLVAQPLISHFCQCRVGMLHLWQPPGALC
jgi:hypothetical protein